MIEHIVISGGGPTGFISYGCLKHLEQNGVYNINNIKSILWNINWRYYSSPTRIKIRMECNR